MNAAVFGLMIHLPVRPLRRLDRHGLDGTNELPGGRCIDAKPAEHHRPGYAVRRVASVTPSTGWL